MIKRIMFIESQKKYQRKIKLLLKELKEEYELVGICKYAKDSLPMVEQLKPDIVIMDILDKNGNTLKYIKRIKEKFPETQIVIYTEYIIESYVKNAIRSGIDGYLLKEDDDKSILEAIRIVARGQIFFHPRITALLINELWEIDRIEKEAQKLKPEDILTKREFEVLMLMVSGKNNKTIAEILQISEKTVKNHVSSILAKLDVYDRMQAVLVAIKRGWIKIE